MKQKRILGFFALAIVAVLGVGMVSAFGFGKNFINHELTEEEKTGMKENMEAMRTAIENEDFDSWKSLMEEQIAKMQEQITQENFDEIVARHQEMKSCDDDACPMSRENFENRGPNFMRERIVEESSE